MSGFFVKKHKKTAGFHHSKVQYKRFWFFIMMSQRQRGLLPIVDYMQQWKQRIMYCSVSTDFNFAINSTQISFFVKFTYPWLP